MLARLKSWMRRLKREVVALYHAGLDPRTPRLARWLALALVAYALSPIDLIPDVIPVLGLLDDLILLPLGIALVIRLIPAQVLAEHRARVDTLPPPTLGRWGAALVAALWIAAAALAGWLGWRYL